MMILSVMLHNLIQTASKKYTTKETTTDQQNYASCKNFCFI